MSDTFSNVSGLLVNCLALFLFFKFLWPLMKNCISIIDSSVIALLGGLIIRSKIFHSSLHPVFLILIIAGLFAGSMWMMHTKYGFVVSSLLMSNIWTDIIISLFKGWESYDLIWGVFIGICSFALIFYFHWKDYYLLKTA
ncbi:hypothetical protein [Butyrivibrio fibrisolvens]|uniref:hypothetical protein n=1 Tax=Butyrivibrio fibrisolvens TaxID=831 RepID=UPI0012BBFC55|nr:hypothetical protein [Butyrivibrio fibrisolvens]